MAMKIVVGLVHAPTQLLAPVVCYGSKSADFLSDYADCCLDPIEVKSE